MFLTPVHSPCYTQARTLRANRSCIASITTKGVCALSKKPFSFLSHKSIHPLVLQRNVLTRFREPEASHLSTPLQAKNASAFTPSLATTAATPLSITHLVEFYFGRHCEYGEQYAVVGNVPELGSWDVQHAVRMTWHDGDVWKCEVPMRCGEEIEFKFIKINDKNECLAWESLAEREGETPCGGVDLQFPTGTEESLRGAVWESTYSSDSVTLTDVSRKASKAVSTATAAAAPAVGKVVAVDKNGKVSIVNSGGGEGVSDSMTKSDMGKLDSSGAMKNGNDGVMSSTAAAATGAMGVSPLATSDRNLVLRVDPGFKKFSGYLVKVKSAMASESRKAGMGSSGSLDLMGSNDDLFKSSPMRAEDVELKGNLRNTGY